MSEPLGVSLELGLLGFVEDAYDGVTHAFDTALAQSATKAPQEPDLIAALFAVGLPDIGRRWSARCNPLGLELRVSGVFCHQSPIVHHGVHQKDPELGDLLIVNVHTDVFGVITRRALLLQAKVSNGYTQNLGPNEAHQLYLYEHWPPFTYVRPRALRDARRTIRPSGVHDGAEFLLVSHTAQPRNVTHAWLAQASHRLQAHRHLSVGLVEMLAGRYGRPFKPRAEARTGKGWSRVVWDLLEGASSLLFNRRNIGMAKKRRGPVDLTPFLAFSVPPVAGAAARSILGDLDHLPVEGTVVSSDNLDLPPGSQSGPRVVCIETQSQER